MGSLRLHGLFRDEWERRFAYHIAVHGGLTTEGTALTAQAISDIVTAELESWDVNEEDWLHTLPEDAAGEQLSYWGD